jgi:WD40 repeat protein
MLRSLREFARQKVELELTSSSGTCFLMTDVQAITAHSGGVCDLAFEPSGQHLMSCGSDTIVRIYNVPNGNGDLTALQSRDFDHDTLAVAFTTVVRV